MSGLARVKKRRRKKEREARQSRRWVIYILLFLWSQILFFSSSLFRIKEYKIEGNHRVPLASLVRSVEDHVGDSIFLFPREKVQKELQDSNWLIESVDFEWSWNNLLVVHIKERIPRWLVNSEQRLGTDCVDKQGRILYSELSYPKDLKTLPYRWVLEGDKGLEDEQFTPKTVSVWKDFEQNFMFFVQGRNARIFWDAQGEITICWVDPKCVYYVFLGHPEYFIQKAKALEVAQKEYESWTDPQVVEVDLRFKQPVLRQNPVTLLWWEKESQSLDDEPDSLQY